MTNNMNNINRSGLSIVLIAIVFSTLFSCGGSSDNKIITPEIPPTTSSNNPLARLEVPKMQDGNLFVQHSTKEGLDSVMAYCYEYCPAKYHTRWVAFRFDALTKQKNTKRPDDDPFIDDPSLQANQRIGEWGFGNTFKDWSGKVHNELSFDRGHLCASADRLYSVASNEKTFYMSNMSPQIRDFNQGFWNAFEIHVQNLSQSSIFSDTLYVVKGGTIADGQTIGYIERSNGAKVTIPKYYFMALLCCRNGSYKAMGFYMEHKSYGYQYGSDVPKDKIKECCLSIDELESKTGIDFFHNLPDNIETQVESECDPSVWGL